jgi:uncharacterized membrane protein YeaQ/YmgE (transglycosylase-associated protein family)
MGFLHFAQNTNARPSSLTYFALLDPDQSNRKFSGNTGNIPVTAAPHKGGAKSMLESLIAWLLIGAIAGWLASLIVKGHGLGLVGNIVVGIVGAVIAGWLLPLIGFVFLGGILAAVINAVIGAVLLLVIIGFVRQKTA